MAIYYLDVDDEITSAAARIRGTDDANIALVLPPNSRVATSRINFRLLAREAQMRRRRLAIVAPEAAVRSLASSAGLPVFSTVGEYEAAEEDARGSRERAGTAVAAGALAAEGVVATGVGGAGVVPGGRPPGSPGYVEAAHVRLGEGPAQSSSGRSEGLTARSSAAAAAARTAETGSLAPARHRRLGLRGAVLLFLAVVLVVAGGTAAYLLLPSATIVVTPRHESIGPLQLTVTVDPTSGTIQPDALTVPGRTQSFQEQAAATFKSSGVRVDKTKASGTVTFQNCDTGSAHAFPAGMHVTTRDGVDFTTSTAVFLNAPSNTPGQPFQCTHGSTAVTASVPGSSGNVGAGTITLLPPTYNSLIVSVTNANATSGGSEVPHQIVVQADVDKAKAALAKQISDAFAADLANPTSLPPGLTLYPATGQLGAVAFSPDDSKLVGTEGQSFELVGAATGTATAADLSAVRTLASDKVQGGVRAGYELDPGSTSVTLGTPTTAGQLVSIPVTAGATEMRRLDATTLRDQVKGKSLSDARSFLAQYGDVKLDVWPGWVSSIPTYDFRIDLRVAPPAPAAAGPSGSAAASAPPSRAPSPGPTSSPAASPVPTAAPSGTAP